MASDATRLAKDFINTISEDITLYRQLKQILSEQHQAYIDFDDQCLLNNLSLQEPLLESLSKHASLRESIMGKLGLPNSRVGVEALLGALPDAVESKVRSQWQTLESLIDQCQEQNQLNAVCSANFQELLGSVFNPNQHTYSAQP